MIYLGKPYPSLIFYTSSSHSCKYSLLSLHTLFTSLVLSGCWDCSTSDAKVLALVATCWLGDWSYGENSPPPQFALQKKRTLLISHLFCVLITKFNVPVTYLFQSCERMLSTSHKNISNLSFAIYSKTYLAALSTVPLAYAFHGPNFHIGKNWSYFMADSWIVKAIFWYVWFREGHRIWWFTFCAHWWCTFSISYSWRRICWWITNLMQM